MQQPLFIMGIDPGLANTGWGVIEVVGQRKSCLAYGNITTSADEPTPDRLMKIYEGIKRVVDKYHPTELGIEEIFFAANVRSAIATGQARGAALVAVGSAGINVGEYSPLQIKQNIVGTGTATKEQVTFMVRTILELDHDPKPDHAADALGAAICHANMRSSYEHVRAQEQKLEASGELDPSNAGEGRERA